MKIAPEIVTCIAEGREPTVSELCRVADRIEQDLNVLPSAFAWGGARPDSSARLINLRYAHAALLGGEPESKG